MIEEEYKQLKNDYGDRISTQAKNKLQKYLNVAREMFRYQIIKPGEDRPVDDKALCSVKAELNRLRCEIEGEIKLQMTDYQAFTWKLSKISHK